MLRLRDGQTELFDALMPPDARVLSAELAKVDATHHLAGIQLPSYG